MNEAIYKLFGQLEPEMVNQMMRAADTDGDGEINLDEFKVPRPPVRRLSAVHVHACARHPVISTVRIVHSFARSFRLSCVLGRRSLGPSIRWSRP